MEHAKIQILRRHLTGRRADRQQMKLRSYNGPLQHAIIKGCGHKFDPTRQPRMRNCDTCWFNFFVTNEQLIKDTDVMFRTQGGQRIVDLQGLRFLEKFLGFMNTMAEWQEQAQALEAQQAAIAAEQAKLAAEEEEYAQ